MKKQELRQIYKKKRNHLSKEDIKELSYKIFKNFIASFSLNGSEKIHIFLSINDLKEVDTSVFMKYFFQKNIKVFVPKIINQELISVEMNENSELIKNAYKIPEPKSSQNSEERDFNYIIAPLLYCDFQGNRVGYGKGFYDRFFSKISNTSIKIGVNFFNPEEIIDDICKTDIALDYLITPTEILSFLDLTSKFTK